MAYLIPESTVRLQATAFVTNAELEAVGKTLVLRRVAERLCEQALRKLMDDCIAIENHAGYAKMITLDVFVLSPVELHKMLAEVRGLGGHDAEVAVWQMRND